MYYIGTLQEVTDYNALCSNLEHYSEDLTEAWSDIIKHQTLDIYAVVKNEKHPSSLEEVSSLDGWFSNDPV